MIETLEETYTAIDGTEGWLGHAPTIEELKVHDGEQAKANEKMAVAIAAREAKNKPINIVHREDANKSEQPGTAELITSLRGSLENDTDSVVKDLREGLDKN